jgi:hypothetical protein
MVDGCGEDRTSFGIGLIFAHFCYLIAVVACRILIVVSAYRIRSLAIVVSCYLVLACRILIVVFAYRIRSLAIASYSYPSLCLSYS